MRVKQLQAKGFKRFTNLSILELPETAKLVVLTGPNGSGKSSLFDAFKMWHICNGGGGGGHNEDYHRKKGETVLSWGHHIKIEFHDGVLVSPEDKKKAIYIRSAYRNEPNFITQQINRMGSVLDGRKITMLIDNDSVVSENYQRLVSSSIESLYSGDHDSKKVYELRELFVGQVRQSMSRVFDELLLKGLGDPLDKGTFYFEKGTSKDFHYMNLSGGEKAAFDLILDIVIKRMKYDNTIYCIDEPEAHMHTRLQSRLLEEIANLIPANSQLWIATHSIGMMRKAKHMHAASPQSVVFLDFHEQNFDEPVTLKPKAINRGFWKQTLGVALDDLADLIAPAQIVLCEGKLTKSSSSRRSEFDARCYRTIFFGEFSDTDFLSVGNSLDVESDRLQFGQSIQTLLPGTKVIRVVDCDDKSTQEIEELQAVGVRVLSKRQLESYLFDDEIIEKLCTSVEKASEIPKVIQAKTQALADSQARGNPSDDIKSASGQFYTELKRLLTLTGCGDNTEAFLKDTMAPLVTPDTQTYQMLKTDIFGGN